jgi:hypothetical protein
MVSALKSILKRGRKNITFPAHKKMGRKDESRKLSILYELITAKVAWHIFEFRG